MYCHINRCAACGWETPCSGSDQGIAVADRSGLNNDCRERVAVTDGDGSGLSNACCKRIAVAVGDGSGLNNACRERIAVADRSGLNNAAAKASPGLRASFQFLTAIALALDAVPRSIHNARRT